jgi:hypothetical protein
MSTNLVSISTGTPPAAPPETNEPMSILDKAKGLRITNSIEYIVACDARLAIDDMITDRKNNHDPVVAAAHKAHLAATEARRADLDPLIEARRLYQQAITGWQREQEVAAEEERRRQQKEIEAQAFEAREAEIVEAEVAGASVEEVKAIVEREVYVPPVVAPARPVSVPKVSGIRKIAANWKAVLNPNDPEALFKLAQFVVANRQFLSLIEVNESSANSLAKGLKATMQIPGLVAYDASLSK